MPDPVVHITGGIPDSGTGNITTLGQTVQPQASTTTGELGPLVQGASVSAAPTYTNGTTNPLTTDLAGNLRTNITNASIAVTGTFWQTTQPISGTVTANQGAAGSAWPVTLTSTTITGTVAVTQSGTWTVQQGTPPWNMKPDGTSWTLTGTSANINLTNASVAVTGTFWQATQPVSIAAHVTVDQGTAGSAWPVTLTSTTITGTVAATQSGNWTSRVVGNAGGIMDFVGQNAGAPANALLIGGEFNTTPTTILTGNASPLQLDSAGNLLVNIKAGGGSGGTSSSFGSAFPGTGTAAGAEYLSAAPTLTSGQMVALQTDVNGNLKVNIQAGAGSGGTASSVGGALPGQGTLALGSVTTGAPSYTTATANSLSLNTSGGLRVDGSAVTQPVSGTFWQTTQPVSGTFWQATQPVSIASAVTVAQATAANLNATVTGTVGISGSVAVTGTFWQATQPISAAALPLPSGASTSALQSSVQGVIGNATAPASMVVGGGVFNTTKPTLTTGQSAAFQSNSSGIQLVDGTGGSFPVSGSVGITGTAAVTQSGTWTVQPGNTANTTAWLVTGTGGTFPVTGTFWQATQPVSIAAAVTVSQPTAANLNATVTGTVTSNQGGAPWTVQRVQTAASNGLTNSRVVAAATTNATSLKTSAGNIAAIDVFNVATYMVFLKLYNKASAPTVGTDTPVWTIPIPAGGGFSLDASVGEYFATGIAYAITKLQADTDTTAIAAGDVTGRIKWV